jgi:hypothetical protein
MALTLLLSAAAFGQSVTDCYNGVGIYLEPSPATLTSYTEYFGPPGTITAYVVLANPYNENTGEPITNLGGYEFWINVPSHVQVSYLLNGEAVNFMIAPEFFVGFTDAPMIVSDAQVLLVTLTIEAVTDEPAYFTIEESRNFGEITCPEDLIVTDRDDNWSVSRGTPVSYDMDAPVFCMFGPCAEAPGGYPLGGTGGVWGDCWVVPGDKTSWGDLRSMFR